MTIRTSILLVLIPLAACKKKVDVEDLPEVTDRAQTSGSVAVPEHVKQLKENFSRVYFEFDSSDLNEDSKKALSDNAAILQRHTDVTIVIEGHADERGTTEYNVALGQRRADIVKSYLASQGVTATRLKAVSFGEEAPLAQGNNESAWSKNRRAEFRVTWGESVVGTVQ